MKGQEGESGINLPLSLTLALDGVGGQNHAAATSPWGKRSWWITEPGWTGAEKLAPTGIPSTDPSSSISKAETETKILKFNVIILKSQSNPFWP